MSESRTEPSDFFRGLDDVDLALAADGWTCRSCGRRFPGPCYEDRSHSEEECVVRRVMEE